MKKATVLQRLGVRVAGIVLGATALSCSTFAAGVDSRAYTCPALQGLIVQYRYIYIGNPNFQDFVVADASMCGGGEHIQVRSVLTLDRPECLVNYCVPVQLRID